MRGAAHHTVRDEVTFHCIRGGFGRSTKSLYGLHALNGVNVLNSWYIGGVKTVVCKSANALPMSTMSFLLLLFVISLVMVNGLQNESVGTN